MFVMALGAYPKSLWSDLRMWFRRQSAPRCCDSRAWQRITADSADSSILIYADIHEASDLWVIERVAVGVPCEHRNYPCSTTLIAERFGRAVRAHWSFENWQDWVLDAVFDEDFTSLRTGHRPQNMAV